MAGYGPLALSPLGPLNLARQPRIVGKTRMAEGVGHTKAVTDVADTAVSRLTDWAGLGAFFQSVGDPLIGFLTITVIVVGVGFIIGTLCYTVRCYLRLQTKEKIELAKLGLRPDTPPQNTRQLP